MHFLMINCTLAGSMLGAPRHLREDVMVCAGDHNMLPYEDGENGCISGHALSEALPL